MLPLPSRRVHIGAATIFGLLTMSFVCVPTSLLSFVIGGGKPPTLPASPEFPSTLDPLSLRAAAKAPDTSARVDNRLDEIIQSAIDRVENPVDELIDDALNDDRSLQHELTEIPSWLDRAGLFGGLESLQASNCTLCGTADGGSRFAQGGLPFLMNGGGFGAGSLGAGTGSVQSSASSDGEVSSLGGGSFLSAGSTTGSGSSGGSGGGVPRNGGGAPGSGGIGVPGGGGGSLPERFPDVAAAPIASGASKPLTVALHTGEGSALPGTTLDFRPSSDSDEFEVEPFLDTPDNPSPHGEDLSINTLSTFDGGVNSPLAPAPVPEPTTLVLTGLGLAGLVARNRRGRAQRNRAESR
jgi:hypothetical protein